MDVFCRNLVENTDRRYRRDWRYVTYRLERAPDGELWWQRHHASPWFHTGWVRLKTRRVWRPGRARARAAMQAEEPAAPHFPGVRHGSRLTPTQARRIAFLHGVTEGAGRAPAWLAADWVREQELPHTAVTTSLTDRDGNLQESDETAGG